MKWGSESNRSAVGNEKQVRKSWRSSDIERRCSRRWVIAAWSIIHPQLILFVLRKPTVKKEVKLPTTRQMCASKVSISAYLYICLLSIYPYRICQLSGRLVGGRWQHWLAGFGGRILQAYLARSSPVHKRGCLQRYVVRSVRRKHSRIRAGTWRPDNQSDWFAS